MPTLPSREVHPWLCSDAKLLSNTYSVFKKSRTYIIWDANWSFWKRERRQKWVLDTLTTFCFQSSQIIILSLPEPASVQKWWKLLKCLCFCQHGRVPNILMSMIISIPPFSDFIRFKNTSIISSLYDKMYNYFIELDFRYQKVHFLETLWKSFFISQHWHYNRTVTNILQFFH